MTDIQTTFLDITRWHFTEIIHKLVTESRDSWALCWAHSTLMIFILMNRLYTSKSEEWLTTWHKTTMAVSHSVRAVLLLIIVCGAAPGFLCRWHHSLFYLFRFTNRECFWHFKGDFSPLMENRPVAELHNCCSVHLDYIRPVLPAHMHFEVWAAKFPIGCTDLQMERNITSWHLKHGCAAWFHLH